MYDHADLNNCRIANCSPDTKKKLSILFFKKVTRDVGEGLDIWCRIQKEETEKPEIA